MNTASLEQLAGWAFRTSLEALPLALVALIIWRWRRLPVAWHWWLPALFFLRLAMPQVPAVGWRSENLTIAPRTASAIAVAAPLAEPAGVRAPERSTPWLPILWAAGCLAVASWIALSQRRLARIIRHRAQPAGESMQQHCDWAAARMALSDRVPVRVMPGWTTMAIYGWWRPLLLVPHDLDERFTTAQIRGMLLHEMAHVRRRDVLWTWAALGLCTLHWFNPLAWLALRRFHADRELACDAAALRALDPSDRHDYGEALLLSLQGPTQASSPALAPFFHRFPELKQRLQNIMNPTSPTPWTRLVTALLVPSLAIVTFTTGRAQSAPDAPKPPPESAERPAAEGEKPKNNSPARIGDSAPRRAPREGEGEKPRNAEGAGDRPREGAREGDRPREGARDGEQPRRGKRDGEAREGIRRDGDRPKEGMRDGDRPREGVRRDGDRPREGARDGDRPREGARDGEGKKAGPRDGEQPRTGSRDGDGAKAPAREGDAPKPGAREGERPAPEGAREN